MSPKAQSILNADCNRRIGRAMHDYGMLADGDHVLVAVSGGIDSLVLAWLLHHWRRKAPISYHVQAVHIDMEPGSGQIGDAAGAVATRMQTLGIPTTVLPADWRAPVPEGEGEAESICFQCARNRRRQLFSHADTHGYTKLALGHHRDDIIETFLLNLTCSGNISTMVPRQDLFSGALAIIRPMAYLDKADIESIGTALGFEPIRSCCPLSEQTRRRDMHALAGQIYAAVPGAKEHIFAALANVRPAYLLKRTGGR